MPPRYLYSIGHQKNMAILNAWLERLVEMEKDLRDQRIRWKKVCLHWGFISKIAIFKENYRKRTVSWLSLNVWKTQF